MRIWAAEARRSQTVIRCRLCVSASSQPRSLASGGIYLDHVVHRAFFQGQQYGRFLLFPVQRAEGLGYFLLCETHRVSNLSMSEKGKKIVLPNNQDTHMVDHGMGLDLSLQIKPLVAVLEPGAMI